jgi:hypothetical protein
MQKLRARNRITYDAVVSWIVANTDTAWADNYMHGDIPPEMGWMLVDLFQKSVEQVVADITNEGR